MTARRLTPEERRLWGAVMATVRPMAPRATPRARPAAAPAPVSPDPPPAVRPVVAPRIDADWTIGSARKPGAAVVSRRPAAASADTLDGGWDKRLARGIVAPDSSIDLHGHSLSSAHALLDAGLARSIARGDRVLLLVTGKPPRPESERPHARGAIRAAVADWLGASRHADRIAAVRGAHPRHGGAGALYIVLRRPRTPA